MYPKDLEKALTALIKEIGDHPINHIEDDYDGITFYVNLKLAYKYDYQSERLIEQRI